MANMNIQLVTVTIDGKQHSKGFTDFLIVVKAHDPFQTKTPCWIKSTVAIICDRETE